MLFALFVHADTLEGEISSGTEMRLYRTRKEKRMGHFEKGNAVWNNRELERDDSRHLNSSTKGFGQIER